MLVHTALLTVSALWSSVSVPYAIYRQLSRGSNKRFERERDAAFEVLEAHLCEHTTAWKRQLLSMVHGDYNITYDGIKLDFNFSNSGRSFNWCKLNDVLVPGTWGRRFHRAYIHGNGHLRAMVNKLKPPTASASLAKEGSCT